MATPDDTPPPEPAPNPPSLAIVVAVAANGVIGRDNGLPWHLPEDLRHFRRLTTGHTIVMGRKTWEAIGRPLPDRESVVLTRRRDYVAPGATVVSTLDDALRSARMPLPVCCIGGEEIFRLALPHADIMYITEIEAPFEGNARFPAVDPAEWRETARERHTSSGPAPLAFSFVTLVRRRDARAPAATKMP